MPAISTLSLTTGYPGSNTFDSTDLALTAVGAPSWFTLTQTGINTAPDPDEASYEYTVDAGVAPGVYTINLSGSPGPYITITISGPADFDLTCCIGESDTSILSSPSVGVWTIVPPQDTPAGLIFESFAYPDDGNVTIVGTEAMDIYLTLEALDAELPEYLVIHITVTQCGLTANVCGDDTVNISWVNLGGGRNSFVFKKTKTLGVETGDSSFFKSGNIRKAASRVNVRDNVVVISGYLLESHMALLKRLKNSIQAWEYNEDTSAWDIPINIDQGDFTWKEVRSGYYEYNLKYSYATEITIQRQ